MELSALKTIILLQTPFQKCLILLALIMDNTSSTTTRDCMMYITLKIIQRLLITIFVNLKYMVRMVIQYLYFLARVEGQARFSDRNLFEVFHRGHCHRRGYISLNIFSTNQCKQTLKQHIVKNLNSRMLNRRTTFPFISWKQNSYLFHNWFSKVYKHSSIVNEEIYMFSLEEFMFNSTFFFSNYFCAVVIRLSYEHYIKNNGLVS